MCLGLIENTRFSKHKTKLTKRAYQILSKLLDIAKVLEINKKELLI